MRDDSNAVVTLSNHYGTDFDTNVVTFKVTVASSTSAHTYHGTGSSNKYKINGVFSPYLKLIPRITYRFDQSDSSNSDTHFFSIMMLLNQLHIQLVLQQTERPRWCIYSNHYF